MHTSLKVNEGNHSRDQQARNIYKRRDFHKYLLQYFSPKPNPNTMVEISQCQLKAMLLSMYFWNNIFQIIIIITMILFYFYSFVIGWHHHSRSRKKTAMVTWKNLHRHNPKYRFGKTHTDEQNNNNMPLILIYCHY